MPISLFKLLCFAAIFDSRVHERIPIQPCKTRTLGPKPRSRHDAPISEFSWWVRALLGPLLQFLSAAPRDVGRQDAWNPAMASLAGVPQPRNADVEIYFELQLRRRSHDHTIHIAGKHAGRFFLHEYIFKPAFLLLRRHASSESPQNPKP